MNTNKHPEREAAETTATSKEITEALKIENHVERMMALQECGLEVVPVQGAIPVEKPWTVPEDEKQWEKRPAGKPITQEEWEIWDALEEKRVGTEAPMTSRSSRNKKGEPKHRYIHGKYTHWKTFGKKNPLLWDENDSILDHLEDTVFASAAIFNNDVIGIDADTPSEVAALREFWKEHNENPRLTWTTKTPGVVTEGEDGEQVVQHKAGGHIWIRMPDGWETALPSGARGNTKVNREVHGEDGELIESGFAIHRHGSYFLTAGSTRSEGSYRLVGEVVDATTSGMRPLVKAIIEAFTPPPAPKVYTKKFEPRYDNRGQRPVAERLEEWSDHRPWASIFTDLQWRYMIAHCSSECAEFFHPDSSSGQYSGIAHGESCSSGPVPGGITLYSDTARNSLGFGFATKYRFVLEAIYSGSTDNFYAQEPIEDTKWKPGENRPAPPRKENPSGKRYTSNKKYGR